jgi:hypothetical protein
MEEFTFWSSFNMGVEGFSKPVQIAKMDPIYGHKREFIFLFALLLLTPMIKSSRIKNEDALREVLLRSPSNRYAELQLDSESRNPSKWTL